MARTQNRQLVYGVIGDELVIMPVDRARYLALTWKAMTKAKTWGALRTLAPPRAYREILAFQGSPRSIRAGHPFDYYVMTPVPDGDYPGFPRQEVMGWMPTEVLQAFSRMEETTMNGTYPSLDAMETRELVASLRRCGYRCRRSQRLIEAAHGD